MKNKIDITRPYRVIRPCKIDNIIFARGNLVALDKDMATYHIGRKNIVPYYEKASNLPYKCSRCGLKSDVSSANGLCEFCQESEDNMDKSCLECGQPLSPTEIKNNEDTCYPCQKGNTN